MPLASSHQVRKKKVPLGRDIRLPHHDQQKHKEMLRKEELLGKDSWIPQHEVKKSRFPILHLSKQT